MNKIALLFTVLFGSFSYSQTFDGNLGSKSLNWTQDQKDFNSPPRIGVSPMSIRLWDNNEGSGAPSNWGSLLEINGRGGHLDSQLYFDNTWDGGRILYRSAFYQQTTWESWRYLLDSKSDVESSGNLKITGAGSSYVLGNNFGIGVLSPESKLDVLGQVKSYNAGFGQVDVTTSSKNYANFSTNNHGSVLISSNLYVSNNDFMKIANTHPSLSGAAILFPGNNQPGQGKIQFFTTNPSSVTQDQVYKGAISMEITGNGNVGIGKTNPLNKLDVNGTIHSQEVKVDMDKWSDFVFKKEYNLPTLEEVEKHIAEKGHLQNIPNEKEVLEDGINLGEMNAKLLQKIEEMTLYMIEQNKKIKDLENRLEKVEIKSK